MSGIGPISETPDPLDLLPGPSTNVLAFGVTVTPVVNRVHLTAFQVARPTAVANIRISVGTQSGNIAVGIYSATGVQLTTSGSVAVGVPGTQTVPVTPITLLPGVKYFMAMQIDNTTARFVGVASTGSGAGHMVYHGFCYTVDTTFPLPTPLTLSTSSAIVYYLMTLA